MRIFILLLLNLYIANALADDLPLSLLHVPPGFTIDIYASPVPDARSMTLGKKGTVFVGSRTAGKVYAIIPDAHSPHRTRVLTIASNLNMPNGVAFHQGALYVAEVGRILRFDDIENHLSSPPKPHVVTTVLPDEKIHGWRYMKFGPDDKLYVSIGMPCNVCLLKDVSFGTISRMNANGTQFETYTKGIRNSVGFAWDPQTKELWFTDNGRDWMGDDLPPDELNHAPIKDLNFGFPYFYGKNLPDPFYGKLAPASEHFSFPSLELPAHVAALGMTFYTGNMFPADYQDQLFIAEHGSWNRSKKVGYQVIVVKKMKGEIKSATPFITGWLQGEKVLGRPVDVMMMPDGALLISDDLAGVIYRVSYSHKN